MSKLTEDIKKLRDEYNANYKKLVMAGNYDANDFMSEIDRVIKIGYSKYARDYINEQEVMLEAMEEKGIIEDYHKCRGW